jgi:hypothetical protein
MKWLVKWWLCKIWGDHDWTCNAEQGIDPTEAEVRHGVHGFFHYAKMYCKRCGHIDRGHP